MPAPRKRSANADDAFFAALGRGITVKEAAALTGCSRQALYQRRLADGPFNNRWLEAERIRSKREESRIRRRKPLPPIFAARSRGQRTRRFGDGELLARLKVIRPDLYRDDTGGST